MTDNNRSQRTNNVNRRYRHKDPQFRMGVFSFITAVAGAAVGFSAAFAVAIPMMHGEFANQTKELSGQIASLSTAPSFTKADVFQPDVCAAPASGESGGMGQVLRTSISNIPQSNQPSGSNQQVQPGQGGGGAGGGSESEKVFPTKVIGEQIATNTATMSMTGPHSSNSITQTNTNTTNVTNTNTVTVSSTNNQSAVSGNANVSTNTTGGSATTGNAENSNSQQFAVKINN